MVESKSERLDHVFHAFAHPVRREILRQLAREDRSITELAAPHDMSLEAVSKHVQVLERARLVRRTREGRGYRCQLSRRPLRDMAKVLVELSALWNKQLDGLERLLAELETKE
jgi:DNA-binding transcriptional ArsR family regulator